MVGRLDCPVTPPKCWELNENRRFSLPGRTCVLNAPRLPSSIAVVCRVVSRSEETPWAAAEDLTDEQLQSQIDAMLRDLDADMLLEDTPMLLDAASKVLQPQQEQEQQPESTADFNRGGAGAWQDEAADEATESGMPEHVTLTRAEYKRKVSVLVELLNAMQAEASGTEALQQTLAAFAADIDEALLHLLGRRLEAARQLQQESGTIAQLELLQSLLQVEYERAQATPAMRLLDEVLDMLGDDLLQQGGLQQVAAVIQRLRSAFTGGASEDIDIFAAAAALASDKSVAADALTVEFVEQASFLTEGRTLLQQSMADMASLEQAVTEAQSQLQQMRNKQPELLDTPQAKQHIQQVAHADEVLQRRKLAVAQLTYVLELAQDLDAAERAIARADVNADASLHEQLAALLGSE